MARHVYVSFSDTEGDYAALLIGHLATGQISAWVRPSPPPDPLPEIWTAELERSDAVVVLWSPDAAASPQVRAELELAARQRKPVGVLRLSGELPELLQRLPMRDVSGGVLPGEEYLTALGQRISPAVAQLPLPRIVTAPLPPPRPERHWVAPTVKAAIGLLGVAMAAVLVWLMVDRVDGPPRPIPAAQGAVQIGVDLPFHGARAEESEEIYQALQVYLDFVGGRAGRYAVSLTRYDSGGDEAACALIAGRHLANVAEVATIGPLDASCVHSELAVIGQPTGTPLVMLSPTDVGADPDGAVPADAAGSKLRAYGRVLPAASREGVPLARFAADNLKLSRCYLLDDGQADGMAVAQSFVAEATRLTMSVIGQRSWNPGATDNQFQPAKAAGADCVVLAGSFDGQTSRLLADRTAALGTDAHIRVLGSSGLLDSPFAAGAEGAFLVRPGLTVSALSERSDIARLFVQRFTKQHGHDLRFASSLYAVQGLQIILDAVFESRGDRTTVRQGTFLDGGVTIKAADAVLGVDVNIWPITGDGSPSDYTILTIQNGRTEPSKVLSI